MGEPMYLFLQHCSVKLGDSSVGDAGAPPAAQADYSHDFDQDRKDVDQIQDGRRTAEAEYAEVMQRITKWKTVQEASARRAQAAAAPRGMPPRAYDALPAGYGGSVGGAQPPAYQAPTPSPAYPTPPPTHTHQPPPPYGGYPMMRAPAPGAVGAAPPSYGAAVGGRGPAPAAATPAAATWRCPTCTLIVPMDSAICPVCGTRRP